LSAVAAIVFGPGEGTEYSARGTTMHFKALSETTDGAFSLMERSVPPGAGAPPPHKHPGAEGFYVLAGELTFDVGEESAVAAAGSFVLVPKHVGHTFRNASGKEARVLIIHSPAADAYFAELHRLFASGSEPDVETQRELQRRHGWEPA
jgi:quercetin dioxygenase-like cupin family protein